MGDKLKHTETPWERSGRYTIKGINGEADRYYYQIKKAGGPPYEFVGELDCGYGDLNDEANIDFILEAVNNYLRLKDIEKAARDVYIKELIEVFRGYKRLCEIGKLHKESEALSNYIEKLEALKRAVEEAEHE